MIEITVTKGNYPVSTKKIKEIATKTLEANGIISDSELEISIVGKEKMDELNEKYYKDEVYEHPIFTFPESLQDGNFEFPPDGKIHLGQIVISYPFVLEEANEKNKLIDDLVGELVEHGCLHLVGIHH
ncbi:MAG TPA: rRNA maturation RNase YbeY [Patescibacteria group bacterium]|nr:rRNA maturation RNase YbeY [Patescibacteria group bacterium]